MVDNSEEAFVQQINQNLGIAHSVCGIYFTDEDDKSDLIQEMLYQLWKSYPGFDGLSKFSTWMYRVCLNTALTYLRKERKIKKEKLSITHHEIPENYPENKEENLRELYQAISTLSSLNKAIVLLYLEDHSYEEISQITGLSKSNVSVRLVRIKKELEIKLKKQLN